MNVIEGEQPALACVVAGLCAWELAGLLTHRVPTITAAMRRCRPVERAVILTVVAAALTDHFFTRRWVR